jgi:hypothetical protein
MKIIKVRPHVHHYAGRALDEIVWRRREVAAGESLAADGARLLGLIGRLPTLDAPTGPRKDSD